MQIIKKIKFKDFFMTTRNNIIDLKVLVQNKSRWKLHKFYFFAIICHFVLFNFCSHIKVFR